MLNKAIESLAVVLQRVREVDALRLLRLLEAAEGVPEVFPEPQRCRRSPVSKGKRRENHGKRRRTLGFSPMFIDFH